jgi:predicted Zn-dependent protease
MTLAARAQAKYCFRMALKAHRRSRYVHLTWASMEKSVGHIAEAARLIQAGMRLNPTDSALPQVRAATWLCNVD